VLFTRPMTTTLPGELGNWKIGLTAIVSLEKLSTTKTVG
jgi:hypothetical protein